MGLLSSRSDDTIQFSGYRKTLRPASHTRYFCIHVQRSRSSSLRLTPFPSVRSSRPSMHLWMNCCTDDVASLSLEVCRHAPMLTSIRKNSNRLSLSMTPLLYQLRLHGQVGRQRGALRLAKGAKQRRHSG